MPCNNRNLHDASRNQKDEFYTQLSDIEKELSNYVSHFAGKTIFCNCDDPRISNFFRYFALNFHAFKLKRLIATCYKSDKPDLFSQHVSTKSVYSDFNGEFVCNSLEDLNNIPVKQLNGDGDFRSQECIELLKQSDIVCTNPPFSLFREYLDQLIKYDKKFIILGNQNAITYKDVFTYIQSNILWLGYHSGDMKFKVPQSYEPRETRYWQDDSGQKWRSLGNICWFTNLDIKKRHESMILFKKYNSEDYPFYDNFNAIEVAKTMNIPYDYDGVMGVPITFLDKYNPEQFEIVGWSRHNDLNMDGGCWLGGKTDATLNGKEIYRRILIKRIQ